MKYITATIILLLTITFGYSQDFVKDDEPEKKAKISIFDNEKIVYGLNFDLAMWGGKFIFNFSPKIGYLVTPNLLVGTGIEFQYISINTYTSKFNTTIYGVSAFARHRIYKGIFAHAEVNAISLESRYFGSGSITSTDRFVYNGNYLGIAYKTPEEGKSGIVVSILWDFTYSESSPFDNPMFRIGYYF